MKRVLTELTYECELTTQMHLYGLTKKKVAKIKFRAESTIVNQIQTAYKAYGVTNSNELGRIFYKRAYNMYGLDYELELPEGYEERRSRVFSLSSDTKKAVSCVLLCVFLAGMQTEQRQYTRRTSRARTETITRIRRD